MATILIVEDDLGLQKLLEFSLQRYKDDFDLLFAGNGEEAVAILEGQNIDLLVTDIKMPKMDGLALLSHMSINYPAIPCIVLTSYTIPGLEKKLSSSVFRFLKKPVDPAELARLIREGLERAGGDGALSGVSVPGLMQIIEAEEKTCLLIIHANGKKQGAMYFHTGVLHDAVYGGLQGEAAALQLIGMENVQLQYKKLPPKKIVRHIEKGMQGLILEAMRLKDEQAAADMDGQEGTSRQRDETLAEGIRLCQGLRLKKARMLLLQVASQDPENVQALLWLSRTVTSMKQLHVALSRAYKLDAEDKGVKHDVCMFRASRKKGLQEISRCPFCYAPIAAKAPHCHFCGATLVINAKSLPQISSNVNRQELGAALKRFQEVLARELNIPLLFYAALACLHLDEFAAALEYLEQLQQCVKPEEYRYTAKVERILTFIASRQSTGKDGKEAADKVQTRVRPEASAQKKVLVVEDSPTTRKVIKMTLQQSGFDIIEAEDGVEALSKVNDEHPDLVLLDVMLPKLDGYGILSVLKQNSELKAVPVIMLTSKDGLKDKIKGRFSSASAYLTKPFKPEVLLSIVNQHLQ